MCKSFYPYKFLISSIHYPVKLPFKNFQYCNKVVWGKYMASITFLAPLYMRINWHPTEEKLLQSFMFLQLSIVIPASQDKFLFSLENLTRLVLQESLHLNFFFSNFQPNRCWNLDDKQFYFYRSCSLIHKKIKTKVERDLNRETVWLKQSNQSTIP